MRFARSALPPFSSSPSARLMDDRVGCAATCLLWRAKALLRVSINSAFRVFSRATPLSPRLVIYHFVRRCATPAEYLVAGTARGGNAAVFVPIPAFSTDRSRDRASSLYEEKKKKACVNCAHAVRSYESWIGEESTPPCPCFVWLVHLLAAITMILLNDSIVIAAEH